MEDDGVARGDEALAAGDEDAADLPFVCVCDERDRVRVVDGVHAALVAGAAATALYAVRRLAAPAGAFWTAYVPILGGLLELGIVFLAWMAVLEAWRTSRPLWREPRLWLGIALALVPPVVDLLHYLQSWHP